MTVAVAAAAAPAAALLEADGLTVRYGERTALEGVSFAVRRGEIFGFLGPNGAGKSSLFHVLSGLLSPAAGSLRWRGQPASPTQRAYRARLGVVFQSPSLDLKLSGRENLELGASLYGVPRRLSRERIAKALALTELGERAGDRVESYSGGMRRRLELGRVLLHDPELLVMDEPTQGLDLASSRRIWSHLLDLRAERGLTILCTTHDPGEAEHCDRLAVLDGGKLIAAGTPRELRETVGGDVVTIECADPEAVAARVRAELGAPAAAVGADVVIETPRGHELIPRLVELFPAGTLRSVGMRPPTLGDAFVKLTGRGLQEAA